MEHEGQRNLSEFLNSIYIYRCADNASSPADNVPLPAGDASSPGGDASPRRHLFVKARCLDKQIQYIFLLPSWGIEPQLGNADAGTRRPQVRTRRQRTYIYTWNNRTYIYTRGIIPFMFFNTKHKKIVPIICSFKAESVLLPCYSFPAKKSLKKVSFFKSLVYNVLRI